MWCGCTLESSGWVWHPYRARTTMRCDAMRNSCFPFLHTQTGRAHAVHPCGYPLVTSAWTLSLKVCPARSRPDPVRLCLTPFHSSSMQSHAGANSVLRTLSIKKINSSNKSGHYICLNLLLELCLFAEQKEYVASKLLLAARNAAWSNHPISTHSNSSTHILLLPF